MTTVSQMMKRPFTLIGVLSKWLLALIALVLCQRVSAVEPQVVSGWEFSAYLAADGTVWTWGNNDYGQLGNGTTSTSVNSTPRQVPGLSNVVAISAGYFHVVAALSDGTVKTWGYNFYGQIGDGSTTTRPSPTTVPGLTNVKDVAAGGYHSMALLADGTVRAWGYNFSGQLGDTTNVNRSSPAVTAGGFKFRRLAGGAEHSLGIGQNGAIYAWGHNSYGQLGDTTTTARNSPVLVSGGITNCMSIAAGAYHSLAALADGTVRAWGQNNVSQLGDGLTTNRSAPYQPSSVAVTKVIAGYNHSAFLRVDGYVVLWGGNANGQCHAAVSSSVTTPSYNLYLPHNFHCTGSGLGYHTVIVADDGTVHGWGNNNRGQLGNGIVSGVASQPTEVTAITTWSLDAITKIDAGRAHSMALKADGTVWTWGSDSNGELGDDGLQLNKTAPVQVSGLSGVIDIAAGSYHCLALKGNGTVWSWGQDGSYGQLGDDATLANKFTPVQVSGLYYVREIGAGGYHSMAVYYYGGLYTWGANFAGQLGNGATTTSATPITITGVDNVLEIDGGWQHSLARCADGTIRAWGQGSSGQLGNGGSASSLTPVTPSLFNTVSIAAGEGHSAATTADGNMYSWGSDSFGMLGDDASLVTRLSPTIAFSGAPRKRVSIGGDFARHSLMLQGNGTLTSVGSDSQGQLGDNVSLTQQPTPVAVAGLTDIVQIAAGDFHSLALRHDGVVFSWGADSSGQLGNDSSFVDQPTPVQVQSTWLPTITYNLAASLPNASEPSIDGSIAFTRSLVNQGSVTVTYAISGSAVEGADYTSLPIPRRLVIPGATATASVVIDPIDNAIAADPKSVTLTLQSGSLYQVGSPAAGSVTISDNDVEGIIVSSTNVVPGTAITSLTTNENGGSNVTFYVKLNSQPTANVVIPFSSSNTAEGAVSVASLTFTPGVGAQYWDSYQAVTVGGVNDFLVDGDIPYSVVVGQATSVDGRYSVLNPPDISATNRDDDAAGVTFDTALTAVITENPAGTPSTTYKIRLNSQPPVGNNVTVALSPNLQCNVSPSSLTFTNANWNVFQTVTVTAIDDAVAESSQNAVIAHSASGGGYNGVTILNMSIPITDNDTAGYTITRTSSATVGPPIRLITTEAGGQGTFTIRLSSQPTGQVSIPVSSSLTSEGTVSPSSVVFSTSNWNTAQTITVTGVDDPTDDGNQNYQITFGAPTSTDGNYNGVSKTPNPMLMINQNNDSAAIKVDPSSIVTSETGGGTAAGTGTSEVFSVVLNCQPTAAVTVTITGVNPLEHSLSTTSLNFTTMNWSAPQVVTVTGINDAAIDNPVPAKYDITLTATAGATEYATKSTQVSLRNQDDDSPGVLITPSDLTVTEAGGANHSKTFAVRLNTAPASNVTVTFTSGTTAAATISPNVLVFTPSAGSWDVAQNVTVVGVNDDEDQSSDKTSTITAVTSSGDANYNALVVPNVTVTVTDNDTASVVLGSTVLLTTEAGGSALLSVRLNSEPTATVRVSVTGQVAAEGTVSPSFLDFTTANWSTPQNISITGVNDDIDDGDVSYTLTLTADNADTVYSGKIGTVNVTNRDDDTYGIQLLDSTGTSPLSGTLETTEIGGTAQFSVRLTSEPTADVTIALVSSNTAEGTVSPASLTFTSANWDDPLAHVVTVTGQSDLQDDGDVNFTIITEAATSSDVLYSGSNANDVSLINRDNITINRAGVTLSTASLTVTEADGVNHSATFTVVLDSQPLGNVTIFLASADTSEGTVSPAVLTFTGSTWNVAQTVTVTGEDDLIADGSVVFAITTIAASGDAKYNLGDTGVDDVSVTTTSADDVPLLVLTPTSLTTTEAAGGTQARSFSVSLATQPTVPVTVDLTFTPGSADGTEGVLSTSALTFNASTWFVPQFVTVTGVDDFVNDGDQLYDVTLTASGAEYDSVAASVAITNVDDDSPGVAVAPASGLVTDETGVTATFTVRLTSQPSSNVVISLTSDTVSEGTIDLNTLTFTPTDWDQPQIITITGVDDGNTPDGNIAYKITLSAASSDNDYNAIAITDVNVTNNDDDTTNLIPVAQSKTYATVVNLDIADFLVGSDPEATAVTYELSTTVLPSQGTLTLTNTATGAFTYVVPPNTRGDYTFEFRVRDATGKYSNYATCTLHITGGDDLRPHVIRPPPIESENGPQSCVVEIDPASKAGSTAFSYKIIDLPGGISASAQPSLSSPTSFQFDYNINTGAQTDHFFFGILIIDHDRPAATLLPIMIQRKTPLGPG